MIKSMSWSSQIGAKYSRVVGDVHEGPRLARSRLALLKCEDWVGEGGGEEEGLAFGGKLINDEGELGSEGGGEETVGFIQHLQVRKSALRSLGAHFNPQLTKNLALPRLHSPWLLLMRSTSRPGVAIMT